MTTIKAFTKTGTKVEWEYDDPEEAAAFWVAITGTGRSPSTGEKLSRAYLYTPKRGECPDKIWAS